MLIRLFIVKFFYEYYLRFIFYLILIKSVGGEYRILILEGNFLKKWDNVIVDKDVLELSKVIF